MHDGAGSQGDLRDLQDLVNSLDAIVWEVDARTMRFTFVSDAATAILGYPPSAWTDFEFWVSLIHPDERDARASFCVVETREGRDHDFEYRTVSADGRIVWLRDIVRIVRDGTGAVVGLRGLMVDITARKRAEAHQQALRAIAAAASTATPAEVSERVVAEAARLMGSPFACIVRATGDAGDPVVVVSATPPMAGLPPGIPRGDPSPLAAACRTGRPERGPARPADGPLGRSLAALGVDEAVAVPVRVAGRVWGAVAIGAHTVPAGAEADLAELADLMSLAVTIAEQDAARRRDEDALRRQAREQAALARIAVAVADDRPAAEVFATIADATASAMEVEIGAVFQFRGDEIELHGLANVRHHEVGLRLPVGVTGALQTVRRTGRAVRFAPDDLAAPDAIGAAIRQEALTSVVVVPVEVAGGVWGGLAIAGRAADLPPDAEDRMEGLARAVASAVSHAAARAQLVTQATIDPLTGLANHRLFQERLRAEVERARRHDRPLSLVLIDLDEFKVVNDANGHGAGDRALAEVGRRLAEMAGPGDLVARTGGDEFAWLMAETDSLTAHAAAERARAAITGAPLADGIWVGMSAGVCDLVAAPEGADSLLRLTDGALYWAKANGRGATYRYSPDVVLELSESERADRLARQRALAGLRALARAVDAKDHDTREHSERVGALAARLAEALGWEPDDIGALREAALLHDVGKIGVPDAVLFKPGRLDRDEYALVMQHAALGATIASEVLDERQVAWIRGHHERYDGRGYPDRLAGDAIAEGARLLAVADAWDVMTNVRTYKDALSVAQALDECRRQRGAQFCPACVDALEEVIARAPDAAATRPEGPRER